MAFCRNREFHIGNLRRDFKDYSTDDEAPNIAICVFCFGPRVWDRQVSVIWWSRRPALWIIPSHSVLDFLLSDCRNVYGISSDMMLQWEGSCGFCFRQSHSTRPFHSYRRCSSGLHVSMNENFEVVSRLPTKCRTLSSPSSHGDFCVKSVEVGDLQLHKHAYRHTQHSHADMAPSVFCRSLYRLFSFKVFLKIADDVCITFDGQKN